MKRTSEFQNRVHAEREIQTQLITLLYDLNEFGRTEQSELYGQLECSAPSFDVDPELLTAQLTLGCNRPSIEAPAIAKAFNALHQYPRLKLRLLGNVNLD